MTTREIVRKTIKTSIGLPQAQIIWNKADDNMEDIKILIVSDSTGSGTSNWPYKMAEWLSQQIPTHGVKFTPFRFSSYEDGFGQQLTPRLIYTTADPNTGWINGETITGGTSGETGTYAGRTAKGIYLINCSGVFTDGETLTGGTSANTATVLKDPTYIGWQDIEEISIGTGDRTIWVDGFNISGGYPGQIEGHTGKQLKRLGRIYDLIIINHGHNIYVDNMEAGVTLMGHTVSLLKRMYPTANIILTRQNKRYDGTDATDDNGDPAPSSFVTVAGSQNYQNRIINGINRVAASFGCGVIDIYSIWEGRGGKALAEWSGGAPGVHANTAGKAVWFTEVKKYLARNDTIKHAPTPMNLLNTSIVNIAPNPIFNHWTGNVPDGYGSSGTIGQDDFWYETGANSVKLNTSSKLTLNLQPHINFIRGGYINVAVRCFIPEEMDTDDVGGVTLEVRGNGIASLSNGATDGGQASQAIDIGSNIAGWRWVVTSVYVPENSPDMGFAMSTNATTECWIDRVVISPDIFSHEVGNIDFLNAEAPATPSNWIPGDLIMDVSGFGSSVNTNLYEQAFVESDENGNISLWSEIQDTTDMERANGGDNQGKRFGLFLSRLTNSTVYTLAWGSTSNGWSCYHYNAAGASQGTVANGATFTYTTGDYLMFVTSPGAAQGVASLNALTIT